MVIELNNLCLSRLCDAAHHKATAVVRAENVFASLKCFQDAAEGGIWVSGAVAGGNMLLGCATCSP